MVIGILLAASGHALRGMTENRGAQEASERLTWLLELARTEASTRQSYTWVAVREVVVNSSMEVQMVAFYSADGTTNSASTNLLPLGPVIRVGRVGLSLVADLGPETRAQWSGTQPVEWISNDEGVEFTSDAIGFASDLTVTFTPRGEVMLKGQPVLTDGFDPVIGIGMVPYHGEQKHTQQTREAAVVIDGSTGLASRLRI